MFTRQETGELPDGSGGSWMSKLLVAVIALIESPQVCSPKFLTCEQRSV